MHQKQEVTLSNSTSNVVIKVENLGKKYVINHEKGNGTIFELSLSPEKTFADVI